MEFGSLDGGENGEHSGVGRVEISKIFAMQDVFFFGMASFDNVCRLDARALNLVLPQERWWESQSGIMPFPSCIQFCSEKGRKGNDRTQF